MLIRLNRNRCKSSDSKCEKCFAEHLLHKDFPKADCFISIDLQRRPELIFNIIDGDSREKLIVVKDENREKAMQSWISLWEEQAGLII